MADYYLQRDLQREQMAQLQQQLVSQSWPMGLAVGTSALQMQPMPQGFGVGLGGFMSHPRMPHFGTVKEFRNRFKEYTKAEFREMGSNPVIKEILAGMTKLNKEEIKDRIAEHLALV